MILYKNVDISDLESILNNGILSMDECKNYNWDEGKRANNATDVVYLFEPISIANSFPGYGVALLKVDVTDAKQVEMVKNDVHIGLYNEYITDKVIQENILGIYVPAIFKDRVECDLPESVCKRITWCYMAADYYEEDELINCPEEVLEQFAKTAPIFCACYNFFRGTKKNGHVLDLYNIKYEIK